uniref:IS30 family transposase n=1 Tax=Levilactobacillus sp. HBUAS70063 TaxID=3109359 RepID=UPI0031331B9B
MQEQPTTPHVKGHHLTEMERGKIDELHHLGLSNRKIAAEIGVCPQTINNELKRGSVSQVKKANGKRKFTTKYFPEAAQARYEACRKSCHRPSKFGQVKDFLAYFINHFRTDKWSPDAAVGRARYLKKFQADEMVCTKTLYRYIDEQRLEVRNIELTEKTSRRRPVHKSIKHHRLRGRSIDERPANVADRKEFGHFEIDTVVGHRNGQENVILTMIERQSRFEIMRLIDSREADSVAYAMRDIKRQYGSVIKSITSDNGPEFTTLTAVMADTAPVYFAHPYTSNERGTNEVHNRMIRQDLPKGMSFDTISPAQVTSVSDRLNKLPRRAFGYETPAERFAVAADLAQR